MNVLSSTKVVVADIAQILHSVLCVNSIWTLKRFSSSTKQGIVADHTWKVESWLRVCMEWQHRPTLTWIVDPTDQDQPWFRIWHSSSVCHHLCRIDSIQSQQQCSNRWSWKDKTTTRAMYEQCFWYRYPSYQQAFKKWNHVQSFREPWQHRLFTLSKHQATVLLVSKFWNFACSVVSTQPILLWPSNLFLARPKRWWAASVLLRVVEWLLPVNQSLRLLISWLLYQTISTCAFYLLSESGANCYVPYQFVIWFHQSSF